MLNILKKATSSVLLFCLILISFQAWSQALSDEEQELYDLIMAYRSENNLPKIALSKSLTFVAQTHVRDLTENKPNERTFCNMHSWSDKGRWKACCYTDNHSQAECMWEKPSELTTYKDYGYEIAYGMYGAHAKARDALETWKTSPGHNNVILNKRIWNQTHWQAIGIGIYEGYAVVWFGKEKEED